MVEYQRPEFYVEEFVANEYVAVCLTGNKVLTFTCIDCGASIEGKFQVSTTTEKNAIEGNDSASNQRITYWSDVYTDSIYSEQVHCAQFSTEVPGCHTSEYCKDNQIDSTGDGCLVYPNGTENAGSLRQVKHHHISEVITVNFS